MTRSTTWIPVALALLLFAGGSSSQEAAKPTAAGALSLLKEGNGRFVEGKLVAKDIGAKLVIPCHYDMFEFNTADPYEQFVPECEKIGQPYRVLKLGERFTYP